MIRVIIESPYKGDVKRNLAYLNALMLDCLKRDEAPIASHKLYTDILNDNNPEERKFGIEAGLVWSSVAEKIVVGTNFGVSEGMYLAIEHHMKNGVPIEYRSLDLDEIGINLFGSK